MSELLRSGLPCKRCPSSDAMSEYENGFFCFSCRASFYKGQNQLQRASTPRYMSPEIMELPRGMEEELTPQAKAMLYKHHFTDGMIDIARFGLHLDCPIWSPRLEKTIFTGPRIIMPQYKIINGVEQLLFWEGKALDPSLQIKSLSHGGAGEYFYTSTSNKSVQLIIVEDILSAWRVKFATGIEAVAMRGTSANITKIVTHYIDVADPTEHRIFYVWTDHDLAGLRASRKLEALEVYGDVKIVKTPKDPKCYSDNQIREVINE